MAMNTTRARGFTLIELMIVLVVLAVLAAIALPAYQDQVRKSRRASAESHLSDIAARQQAYLLDSRRYAPNLATLGVTTPPEVSAYYTVTCCGANTNAAPPLFIASAAPNTAQAPDLGGATLSIDNAGTKLPATYNGNTVW